MMMTWKPSAVSRLQRLRLVPTRHQRLSSDNNNSYYYDSQSGLHVPVHDESNVKVFLNLISDNNASFRIPPQLYKEDMSSDMPDQLKELQQKGIHGLMIPKAELPRDHRNLSTLLNILPSDGFQLFSFSLPEQIPTNKERLAVGLPYSPPNEEDATTNDEEFESSLQTLVENGLKTAIVMGEECYRDGVEPVIIANKIASFIDAHGGGDFLWLSVNTNNREQVVDFDAAADNVVRLCEELMYLDLPGATVKSRMMVDAGGGIMDHEVIDETMMLGVNKFVVDAEEQVDAVREIAEEQGKTLLVLSD